MGKVDVTAHGKPLAGFIASLHTGGIALIIRAHHDTLIIQIAQGSIELSLLVAAIHTQVILLAKGIAISLVYPVIRQDGVYLSVVVHTIAQCGIRIQLAIVTDEILTVGHTIRKIAQAAFARTLIERGIGIAESLIRSLPLGYVGAVKSAIISFEILRWIVDGLIALGASAAPTQFGIKRDDSLARITLLGGHDDDTIGTAGSIERIAGSILQYGDTRHIVRVDAVPQSIVWHTIQDDERVITSIERTDTTDTKLWSGIRRTRRLERLQTSHIALQGIHHVVDLSLLQRLAVYHACRTREGRLLLFAVCHDDDLIKLAILRAKANLHTRGSLHGLRFHTQIVDDDLRTTLDGGWQRELAIHVGNGTRRCTLHFHLSTDDRFSILIDHTTAYRVRCLRQCLPPHCHQQQSGGK